MGAAASPRGSFGLGVEHQPPFRRLQYGKSLLDVQTIKRAWGGRQRKQTPPPAPSGRLCSCSPKAPLMEGGSHRKNCAGSLWLLLYLHEHQWLRASPDFFPLKLNCAISFISKERKVHTACVDACHPADSMRDKQWFALARKLALQRKKPAQGFSLGEKGSEKNRLESKFPCFFASGESFSHAPLEGVQEVNVSQCL